MLFKRDTWTEIYHALSKNKLRTALTMIGVAWGMLLFVFLLGLVSGMRNGFDRDLKGLSTNSMFLWTESTSMPYKGFGRGRSFDLNMSDVQALKDNFPQIKMIAPRNRTNSTVVHNTQYGNYMVFGDYPEVNKMFVKKIIYGRFLNNRDIETTAKVCVIGEKAVEEIYENIEDAVGTTVKINGIAFTVIGVYERANNGPMDQGKDVYIPSSTFGRLYNIGDDVGWMAINIKDEYNIKEAENQIKLLLKERHDAHPDDTQAVGSFNLGEMFSKLFNFMKGLEFLTVIVGFLTLFSGVIAVSSILLITVKERTKEFGIRRALGAKPIQIIIQILLESAVITFFSGLLGIISGTLILAGINSFVEGQPDSNIPLVNSSVNVSILILAFTVVLIMALFAGLLPATRAIAIKPIDALREE